MKRGQLRIQETGLVIFIIVIIMIIGFFMFFRFQFDSIDSLNEEYEQFKYEELISYLPSMSELRYSRLGKDEESIDLYKARAFSEIDKVNYRSIFGFKKIVLIVDGENLVLYDFKLAKYTDLRKISSPISVYNPNDGRFYVGLLEVYRYV